MSLSGVQQYPIEVNPSGLELIAPAGNLECARAAVANGADAVYFGLPKFNARIRADNFTHDQLIELVTFLHSHGVRAFTTLNTLIFTSELKEMESFLIEIDQAGIDAIIVQDVGVATLAHQMGIRPAIHASTQMTITSSEGVQFAARLGVKRVVVARETSMRELAKIDTKALGVSLETFVHGALCVAYSGQCLTSEALGQRSANRGECAQACRLPYDLIVDGVLKDLGDRKYLLSPQDLSGAREIPELIRLGVTGFKIEGRLKTPEYVAAITRVYRRIIDACLQEKVDAAVSPDDEYQMEMAFSRGLYSGWLHGVNHQKLVHARYGKKRGPFAGKVIEVGVDWIRIDGVLPLKPGDGIVIDQGTDTDREQGGRIYEMEDRRLFFKYGHIQFSKINVGDRIWKTDDPQFMKEIRKTYEKDLLPPAQTVDVELQGQIGNPLHLVMRCGSVEVDIESRIPLQKAEKRPLDLEILRQQLGRLGGTGFQLGNVKHHFASPLIVPVSELNWMRRSAVEKLQCALKEQKPTSSETNPTRQVLESELAKIRDRRAEIESVPDQVHWSVLVRTMEQLDVALTMDAKTIHADFEDIRRYREVVQRVREHGESSIFLATPRIQKAGEQGFFKLIDSMEPDGVLIRNLGGLDYYRKSSLRKMGDFSLNIANPIAAKVFKEEGLQTLCPSYDLNIEQLIDLLQACPVDWFEVTLHQHLPMFHMEHCVFAAFLSEGTDHTNCGRPCDRHELRIRDRTGVDHLIKADVGCRNTIYHHRAQSGINYWQTLLDAGLRRFRIELLDENATRTRQILESYWGLEKSGGDASTVDWDAMKVVRQLGVTSGTLTVLS